MTDERFPRPRFLTGMSGRLLALTVCFVMLAEVLVYLPSVARFRKIYLEDQIAKAHLAALALEASPNKAVDDPLAMDLLVHAGAHAIVLKSPHRRMLMLGDRVPSSVDATFDLGRQTFVDWIGQALATLMQRQNRILRVIAPSPRDPGVIEVLLDETPLRRAMYAYSGRILTLSIIISLIAAALVYWVLQWWMVRPMARLTDSMMRFSANPEDEGTTVVPSGRSDEIGIAERELAAMQREVRGALRQKTRLAAVGSAVAKIHHDLRNMLATAVLASDRLAGIDDPEVQRLVPRLYEAIDRAVTLTSRTLDFLREEAPPLRESVFGVRDLLADVERSIRTPDGAPPLLAADGSALDSEIAGDRDQLFRVFTNLALNAAQAGATTMHIDAERVDSRVVIDVRDDGTGIPAKVRERLFLPFAGSGRHHGAGLGLVIAREIVVAHGGVLSLVESGAGGTTFRVELPLRRSRSAAPRVGVRSRRRP
jgi:signal transduction histidine kinase